jgi:putative transposase
MVATRGVEEGSTDSVSDATPIGVDIGEAALLTVCHRDERGTPTAPTLWNDEGKEIRRLWKAYFTATKCLQERGSESIAESFGDQLWRQIDHILHTVMESASASSALRRRSSDTASRGLTQGLSASGSNHKVLRQR